MSSRCKRAGRVDHLQRERVFVPADAANLAAVFCFRDCHQRPRRGTTATDGTSSTCRGRRGKRRRGIQNLLAERVGGGARGRGEIGPDDAATSVHLVTTGALAFPKNSVSPAARFPRVVVAFAAGSPARTPERLRRYDNDLPDLLVCQSAKRRHLGPGQPLADRAEKIAVFGAVSEDTGIQRRTAIAGAARRMTRLARLIEHDPARGDDVSAGIERIARRVGLLRDEQ